MTDKCRRRINRREGYITTEISQRRGDGQEGKGGPETGRPRERKEAPVWPRGVGAFLSSSKGSLLPGTLGRPILCVFYPQNKSSPYQSSTFGPTLYKFIVMGSIRKPWPYKSHEQKHSVSLESSRTLWSMGVFSDLAASAGLGNFLKGRMRVRWGVAIKNY